MKFILIYIFNRYKEYPMFYLTCLLFTIGGLAYRKIAEHKDNEELYYQGLATLFVWTFLSVCFWHLVAWTICYFFPYSVPAILWKTGFTSWELDALELEPEPVKSPEELRLEEDKRLRRRTYKWLLITFLFFYLTADAPK